MTGDGPDPTNEVVESPSQLSVVRLHWGGPRWTRTTSSAVERPERRADQSGESRLAERCARCYQDGSNVDRRKVSCRCGAASNSQPRPLRKRGQRFGRGERRAVATSGRRRRFARPWGPLRARSRSSTLLPARWVAERHTYGGHQDGLADDPAGTRVASGRGWIAH